MTTKLWTAIKDYIDAAIENNNSTHVEDSIRKRAFDKDVEKLLEGNASHLSNDDYAEIQKHSMNMDEDEFRRWMKEKYVITYF